jgi:hypothetical protein
MQGGRFQQPPCGMFRSSPPITHLDGKGKMPHRPSRHQPTGADHRVSILGSPLVMSQECRPPDPTTTETGPGNVITANPGNHVGRRQWLTWKQPCHRKVGDTEAMPIQRSATGNSATLSDESLDWRVQVSQGSSPASAANRRRNERGFLFRRRRAVLLGRRSVSGTRTHPPSVGLSGTLCRCERHCLNVWTIRQCRTGNSAHREKTAQGEWIARPTSRAASRQASGTGAKRRVKRSEPSRRRDR